MRLTEAALVSLPNGIARPAFDRAQIRTGVIHFGVGAFHRPHQAPVFDAALAAGDTRWGIVGVSLRSLVVQDQLAPQNGLYTVVERSCTGEAMKIIGALTEVIVAPEAPGRAIAALASADIHIVTLTITEKGYHLHPTSGVLLTDEADVAADLVSLEAPRTVPGFLVAGLHARQRAGVGPLTIISCDNVPENGERLRGAVLSVAVAHDPALAAWNGPTFPLSACS